jgi:hypothetical protein
MALEGVFGSKQVASLLSWTTPTLLVPPEPKPTLSLTCGRLRLVPDEYNL